jgi:hypothetical protein
MAQSHQAGNPTVTAENSITDLLSAPLRRTKENSWFTSRVPDANFSRRTGHCMDQLFSFVRLSPDWTIEGLAEELLCTIASQPKEEAKKLLLDAAATTDRQSQRVLRPLLACLATKSAAEAGTPPTLYGGQLSFKRVGPEGPVWILGEFENKPGSVRVAFRRSSAPPQNSEQGTSDPSVLTGTNSQTATSVSTGRCSTSRR